MRHHYKSQLIPKFAFEGRTNNTPPVIEINSNDEQPAYLGRNPRTQIRESIVSRQLCAVELSNTGAMSVIMRKGPNVHQMTLDGEKIVTPIGVKTPVYPGSILSLHSDKFCYEVKIYDAMGGVISNPQSPTRNTTASTATAASNSESVSETDLTNAMDSIKSTMVDKLICSVCMDVMWKATIVVPCGHSYCQKCILEAKNCGDGACPKCRGAIETIAPNQDLDSAIFCMIRAGEFDPDDTRDFLQRSGKKLTKAEDKLLKSIYKMNDENKKKARCNKRKINNISPSEFIHVDEDIAASVTTNTETGGNTKEDAIAIE